jgi:hypothetical protein
MSDMLLACRRLGHGSRASERQTEVGAEGECLMITKGVS